ncbi:MAG: hypothetical protein HC845_02475 [Akkermansiaceae bacterium]|nr:hypothetical protein [Akkermansiaceae bacterium]
MKWATCQVVATPNLTTWKISSWDQLDTAVELYFLQNPLKDLEEHKHGNNRKKFRMRTIYLFLANILFSNLAFSLSLKTPVDQAIGNLRTCFEFYKSEHGKYPKNWNDLIENSSFENKEESLEMFDHFRKTIDFENRYTILSPPVIVRLIGRPSKIVMIANQPGNEGNGKEQAATARL